MNKWDARMIMLAKHISNWSKDPSTKVGAVIADDCNRIVSVGYNGLPRGVQDHDHRLADRKKKYPMTIHAERNAIMFATQELTGCTIYVWPFMTCCTCAGEIIQKGISRVVAPDTDNERWTEENKLAMEMYKDVGVEVDLISKSDLQMLNVQQSWANRKGE